MALAALGNYNKKFINNQTYYDIFKKLLKKIRKIFIKLMILGLIILLQEEDGLAINFLNIFGKGRSRNAKTYSDHHKNIASALQKRFEDIYLEIIKFGQKKLT